MSCGYDFFKYFFTTHYSENLIADLRIVTIENPELTLLFASSFHERSFIRTPKSYF